MKSIIHHRALTILTGIFLLATVNLNAQQSNTFYLLHNIPQSNLLNPAVQSSCRWFVGIPGLSSSHVSYSNTAFSFEDLTEGNRWNLENVEGQMHRVDLYGAEVFLQTLAIGHRYKSYYFTFSLIERAHAYQLVPKDLATLAVYGNSPFVGERVRFDPLASFGSYLREYDFGVSKTINRSLTLGVRAKILFGKADVSTGISNMNLHTSENNFSLLANGEYLLNSSMPATVEQDAAENLTGISFSELNYVQFLLNRGNPGFALDLGAIYRLSDKLTLSASLLDMGMVRWKTDLNNIQVSGEFLYEGIGPDDNVASMTFFEEMIDSLRNAFNSSISHNPYNSFLPPQLYLGGSYQLKKHLSVGIVNRNLLFRHKLHSSITLSATVNLKKKLLASVSWSLLNNSVKNIGAALAWNAPGFQFHLVSDNLLGFMQPFDTRTINLRAGFNILFGCPRNKREMLEAASRDGMSVSGNCFWAEKYKQRKKRYRKTP